MGRAQISLGLIGLYLSSISGYAQFNNLPISSLVLTKRPALYKRKYELWFLVICCLTWGSKIIRNNIHKTRQGSPVGIVDKFGTGQKNALKLRSVVVSHIGIETPSQQKLRYPALCTFS